MSTTSRTARLLARPNSLAKSCATKSRQQPTFLTRSAFTKSAPRQADVTPSTSTTTSQAQSRNGTPSAPPASAKLDLSDEPIKLQEDDPSGIDWSSSFSGLSIQPFAKEAADILLAPINKDDVEIKPDGILYLPEIKYRRILNRAFGPGGWGMAPRGETIVTDKAVTREYALLVLGR